ncbi:MAG: hypothetical protein MZV63_58220 [Marinilabiliales bacterium]|nr:hypothetical protein [Marinilabiliales bacterium]
MKCFDQTFPKHFNVRFTGIGGTGPVAFGLAIGNITADFHPAEDFTDGTFLEGVTFLSGRRCREKGTLGLKKEEFLPGIAAKPCFPLPRMKST